MAPRSAKSKKGADVKVAETAPAKKGRKGKQVAEPESPEAEEVKPTIIEKKTKRGKKAIDEELINGDNEETCPPVKKSKKKNTEEKTDEQSNGDNSSPEEEPNPVEQIESGDEENETNGHTEEAKPVGGRGRKKQTKKETVSEIKPKETGRGRKNTKQDSQQDTEKSQDVPEEKSKPSARGRGKKAQAKPSNEAETIEDEVKLEPAAPKGKKKQNNVKSKEKIETNIALSDEDKEDEDIVEEEPKKKEPKSRKNQGKKAQPKEQADEKDEDVTEEPPATKKRRGAKKDDKIKGESKDEEEVEEKVPEVKPTKGKRGAKNATAKASEVEQDIQDTGETTNKRRRKAAEDKAGAEDGKKKASKNKTATDYEDLDFFNDSKTSQGKDWNFKISSWNVDGIRAWMDKGGLEYIKHEKPDILCLQEIKCSKEKLPESVRNVPGYHAYWLCSEQDGYAGVGIYTTKLAMNVQYGLQDEELDSEGRIITAEYEQFYLICTYVPNAGRKLVTLPKRLKWNEEFRKHVKSLDKKKPVIICGDMNVSHNEIDLANPKTNRKNAGFTDEERAGMTDLLGDGFVDTYRLLYPDKTSAYTFWTYMFNCRAKNVGWRLDYFIVSQRLVSSVCDSIIRDSVYGSDHCPVTLLLHLTSADKPKE